MALEQEQQEWDPIAIITIPPTEEGMQMAVELGKELALKTGGSILGSSPEGDEFLIQPRTDGTVFALSSRAAENYEQIFGHENFIGNGN